MVAARAAQIDMKNPDECYQHSRGAIGFQHDQGNHIRWINYTPMGRENKDPNLYHRTTIPQNKTQIALHPGP